MRGGGVMSNFDWDYIHEKCNLNSVRDELWLHSRFFGLRFNHIINLIEDGYYFESLLMLIMLLEQVLASKNSKLNETFAKLINSTYNGMKKETASKIRTLRNSMVHRYLFKFYVSFNEGDEYPLSEMSNYEYILFKLFLPLISCFTDQYNYYVDFIIGEYTVNELAIQYGIEKELDKIINVGIVSEMSKIEMEKIRKENEINLMRLLNNTSPVSLYQSVFKNLFDAENDKK